MPVNMIDRQGGIDWKMSYRSVDFYWRFASPFNMTFAIYQESLIRNGHIHA